MAENHRNFDEQPNFECPISAINFEQAKKLFAEVSKKFTERTARSLELIVPHQTTERPTNGAILLFADNHTDYFPDGSLRSPFHCSRPDLSIRSPQHQHLEKLAHEE